MPDEVDYAFKVTQRELEEACVVPHYTHLIIFVTDEGIQETSFTGTGGRCVTYMEEVLGIDMLNGRWARWHDKMPEPKASDGEMERELLKRAKR